MRSNFSFARSMAFALMAIGTVACISSDTSAANRTWTGTASSPNARSWGTASQYAGNWNPAVTSPTSADTAVFNANSGSRTIQMVAGASSAPVPIGNMVFVNNGANIFNNSAGIIISGSGSPAVGISSTSSGTQTFQGKVIVNSAQQTFSTTAGLLNFTGTLDLNGNYLKGVGSISTNSIGSSVAGATYEVVSGTQSISFDGTTGGNIGDMIVNGGNVSSGGDPATNLSVQGGTYTGGGNFKNVNNQSGLLFLDAGEALSTTNYVQTAGGTVEMNVGYDVLGTPQFFSSNVSGKYQLGGAMILDGALLGNSAYPIGSSWSLFSGVNFTSGSASVANAGSNFSSFAMTTSSLTSPYFGTFTRFGQEWQSQAAPDGTFLVFQAATGNLVVVPEPSTMVFAGLGVAMSGWTMWKKRRLSKLLAAKAG